MKDLRKEQGVLIHWLDSMEASNWRDRDYANSFDMRIQTLGWLIDETDDAYIVSSSVSNQDGIVPSPMKIPKISVTAFWEIEL